MLWRLISGDSVIDLQGMKTLISEDPSFVCEHCPTTHSEPSRAPTGPGSTAELLAAHGADFSGRWSGYHHLQC
jgi:hypothetical protein